MSGGSTLDPDNVPVLPDKSHGQGHDIDSLGPSDTSDSGSDMKGVRHEKKTHREGLTSESGVDDLTDLSIEGGSTSDSHGTGDRASVEFDGEAVAGADIAVDHRQTVKPED